jgi:iron complex outermembrane receptor protein
MRRFALTALASAIITATAVAQTAPPIEEIHISARKRNEANLDVPVTVSVFNEERIQNAGIQTPSDFIALTPNVTLVQTQNEGNSFVTVRGVSQNRNTEMSVAVLMDGVLLSNPAQFNQELFDIQQIEVLKGPQGALYGRNAIGGAITITTKQPSDKLEGAAQVGADNGPGYRAQASVSGPLGQSDTLKFRASVSWKDTDGYIDNTYLHQKADPYKDVSARLRLIWKPTSDFTADVRYSMSNLDAQALYYNIRSPKPQPFPGAPISLGHGSTGDPNSVNDTSLDVRVNNPGVNTRDLTDLSLKMDWDFAGGTFTSITSHDTTEELLTGDAFDFVPTAESIGVAFGYTDQNQSQYLNVSSNSQEFRFVSASDQRLRWIAGVYGVTTKRFISTGNMVDTGKGVFPVYYSPRGKFPYDFATDPANPQVTFLADAQDNFAWAAFGELAYDVSDLSELAFSLRYDNDNRENTTRTPTAFLPNVPGYPQGFTGQVREKTWNEWQPKLTYRYRASHELSYYATLSRGFRSGGFNQTGVGPIAASNGFLGVGDTFDKETMDTLEVGMKGEYLNGRVRTNAAVYTSRAKGTYFFVYLAANSTQNLGNLKEVKYQGFETEITAMVNNNFDLNASFGYTDSEITDSDTKTDIGNRAPNVSKYTFNLGADLHAPVPSWGNNVEMFFRPDFQIIGPTAFLDREQKGTNNRDSVPLLDLRFGVEVAGDWSITAWSKNTLDKKYNAEYSTGGFVFKAPPRRYGIDFLKHF